MQPLNTILGLEEKAASYIEKEVACAPAQLRVFEAEFDDLCEAERLLDDYWDQHETKIEGNAEFKKEMETFQDKLSGVKQTYEDFISLVLDRFAHIFYTKQEGLSVDGQLPAFPIEQVSTGLGVHISFYVGRGQGIPELISLNRSTSVTWCPFMDRQRDRHG